MYLIVNAIKNLGRNKGRNLLIAAIILVLVVSATICMVINTTTGSIISDYKNRFGAEVSIDRDYKKFAKSGQQHEFKDPTHRQIISFGKSDYLQKAEYLGIAWGTLPDLKSPFGGKIEGKPSVYLVGNSLGKIDGTSFRDTNKLVEGEIYKKNGDCLVEKEFAQLNNLSIGDSFSVDVSQGGQGGTPVKRCTLTITGFFENYAYVDKEWNRDLENVNVLLHTDTMTEMEMFDMDGNGWLSGKFFLKEPGMLEAFTKEIRSKGLTDDMKVVADESGYQKVVGPVEGLADVSMTFLVVVLILGCAILLVISVLNIRERKYEIGVLRAMGMGKGKVGLGFFCESLMVTALCLFIGLGIGMALSQPVADILLKGQLAAAQQVGSGVVTNIDSNLKPLSELTVHFDLSSIVGIGMIALLIVLISSIASILYVTRYEPMQILSERN